VTLGDSAYELVAVAGGIDGFRERRVGGISIKREPLEPTQWLDELAQELRGQAAQSAEARVALERLLA
jgi:hypothetical protein